MNPETFACGVLAVLFLGLSVIMACVPPNPETLAIVIAFSFASGCLSVVRGAP